MDKIARKTKTLHASGSFTTKENLSHYYQVWRSRSESRAAVILVHGYAEHSSRYAHVAARLVRSGYEVWAFDLRGHGRSQGRRCYVHSFDDYLRDLDDFLTRVQKNTRNKPLFLLGHSMGGAIVTLYMLEHQPEVTGIVLSAPALKLSDDISPFLMKISRLVGLLLPKLPTVKIDSSKISRDPEVVRLYNSDPLVYRGGTPARTGAELVRATRLIQDKMEEFNAAVLIMHGASDQIADPEGSKQLYERAPSKDKRLRLYPELYHEIMNEPEKEKVLDDIARWLDERT